MTDIADVKRRIMSKVDLGQLIGQNIELERRSGKLFGLCPFHNEKSPSFTIYTDHFYCFGCKASGDAIDYIRKVHGLGFIEALKYLAQKFSVDASELDQNQEWRGERRKQADDYKALNAAQKWFVEELEREPGGKTKSYLMNRGFDEASISEFGFGFAPDDFQKFPIAMQKLGFGLDALVQTSLARRSQKNGRPYAFFRNRLMVPIHDTFGRVIAFGGRTMGDDPAKYVNSSETYIFDKSNTLFGLFHAKEDIRKAGYAIIVEGYMDVLKLRLLGIRNAVACMGTALTTKQLSQLSQFTGSVYLCFDGDSSGVKANLSTVSSALEVPRISVHVIQLPKEEDPDSYISAHGKESFLALKDAATDLLAFAIDSKLSENKDLSRPHIVKNEFIPWLAKIHDTMQRSYLMSRISQLTGIPMPHLEREFLSQTGGVQKSERVQPLRMRRAQPLNSFHFELLGHIYFALPGDLDTKQLQSTLKERCELGEVWQLLFEDMSKSLHRNLSPSEDSKSEWDSATDDTVLATLKRFDEMGHAFRGVDHGQAIEEILADQSRLKRDMTIKSLKANLALAGPDEQLEILRAIQNLKSIEQSTPEPKI